MKTAIVVMMIFASLLASCGGGGGGLPIIPHDNHPASANQGNAATGAVWTQLRQYDGGAMDGQTFLFVEFSRSDLSLTVNFSATVAVYDADGNELGRYNFSSQISGATVAKDSTQDIPQDAAGLGIISFNAEQL